MPFPRAVLDRLAADGIDAAPARGGLRIAHPALVGLHFIEPDPGPMTHAEAMLFARRLIARVTGLRATLGPIVERKREERRIMKTGDRVQHAIYGGGTIRLIDGNQAKVLFDRDAKTRAQRRVWMEDLRPGSTSAQTAPPGFGPQVVARGARN